MRHRHQIRVPFGDVDHAGIVYYPRIYHYFHLAYESLFHDGLGEPFHELFEIRGLSAPVVASSAECLAPLRHGRIYEIQSWFTRLGETSWTLGHELRNADGASDASRVLHARGEVTHVFVELDSMKPIPIEPRLRELAQRFTEPTADAHGSRSG